MAIEKGIEVFLEVFFVYFMITALTLHEMKRQAKKNQELKDSIENVDKLAQSNKLNF